MKFKKIIKGFTLIFLIAYLQGCSTKYISIPHEKLDQEPKHPIDKVAIVDGKVIEFPYGATVRDSTIVGWPEDNDTLKIIPFSELKTIHTTKTNVGKTESELSLLVIALWRTFSLWMG